MISKYDCEIIHMIFFDRKILHKILGLGPLEWNFYSIENSERKFTENLKNSLISASKTNKKEFFSDFSRLIFHFFAREKFE